MRVQHSYGSRIKNAFAGVIIGAILFLGSFALLAWNERDAVRQTAAINEIDQVALADVSIDQVQPENENKLVHMRGRAATQDVLENAQFGVRERAIRLRWDASIYQYEEDEKRRDRSTEYTYEREWVDQVINSSGFHDPAYRDKNAGSRKTLNDGRQEAKDVRFGAFTLSDRLIDQIGNEQQFTLTRGPMSASDRATTPADANVSQAATAEAPPDADPAAQDLPEGQTQTRSGASSNPSGGAVHNGVYYTGDPQNPRIGDEKIAFYWVAPEQDVALMAVQRGNGFTAYRTKAGVGKELLYMGLLTKAEVIDKQKTEAAFKRWLFRLLGFLAMWFGLMLAFKPVKALLSFVPFVDDLVGAVLGFFTFGLAAAMSLVTIAIFWMAARPLMAIGLVALAAVLTFFLFRRKPKAAIAPAAELPTPEILD